MNALKSALTLAIAAKTDANPVGLVEVKACRDTAIAKLIKAAMVASDTLVAKAKAAAKLAVLQFNPDATPHDNVKAVAGLYEEDFKDATGKVNSNVKSIFTDCLWLLAANSVTPISFTSTLKAKEEVHTTAGEAVDFSKNEMRAAAKAVRETVGAGRATGGGRRPARQNMEGAKAPSEPTVLGKVAVAAANDTGNVAFAAWLDNLSAYMADDVTRAAIVAAMPETGYKLIKARTTKGVTPE